LPYTGVKTNVIFFERPTVDPKSGKVATKEVWFYELTNDGFELKQTRRPMKGNQLPDFIQKQPLKESSANSWVNSIEVIVERGYDLSARNPNQKDAYEHRPANELVRSMQEKEVRIIELLKTLEGMLEVSNK